MACDRFAEEIRENAYGLPLGADATAHLAVCSDCQATLETEERILATINTALEELASTGPSPNFVSRVVAHVEHAPRWRPSAWWTPAAVVSLALLVAAVVVGRVPGERSGVREVSTSRPIEVPVVAPAEAANPSLNTAKPETKLIARVRRQPVSEPGRLAQMPEVLVPGQQREAVSRLFTSLRAGRPEVIAMLMSFDGGEPGTDSRRLVIEPLRIEPVVVSALPSSAFSFDK
jgi:hypothetical protein